MHQKNASNEAAGDEDGSVGSNDSPERVRNPFADDDDDEIDSDGSDDDGHLGGGAAGSINSAWGASARGSWWRGMVRRRQNDRFEGDDSESDKEDNDEDDEEFGDFAMPEAEPAPGTDPNERVLLKPLALHPGGAGQGKTGFSGLWPFGAKEAQEKEAADAADAPEPSGVITLDEKEKTTPEQPAEEGKAGIEAAPAAAPAVPDALATEGGEKVQAAVEAKRRTSIEDPDEDEVVVQKPVGV